MSSPTAALLIIGQELLSGKVEDENAAFLTRSLYELGVEVRRVVFVADDADDIVEALQWLVGRHDHVFTTGGLGPTHDDVTLAAVARALERPLVHSPSLERLLEALYGLQEGPERMRLSRIPEGAELFYPEGGRYPQLRVENIYLFPGVPSILRSKFAAISQRFESEPIHSRSIDLERSELEVVVPLTAAVEAFPDLRFGSYPSYDQGKERVRLTLDGKDQDRVEAALVLLKKLLFVES